MTEAHECNAYCRPSEGLHARLFHVWIPTEMPWKPGDALHTFRAIIARGQMGEGIVHADPAPEVAEWMAPEYPRKNRQWAGALLLWFRVPDNGVAS